MTYSDGFKVSSMKDLTDLIDEVGFVPFFTNEIRGFSLEDNIGPKCWYHDGDDGFWPAWEMEGPCHTGNALCIRKVPSQ